MESVYLPIGRKEKIFKQKMKVKGELYINFQKFFAQSTEGNVIIITSYDLNILI